MGCPFIVSLGAELPPRLSASGTTPQQLGHSSGGAAPCQDTRSAHCHQCAQPWATGTLQGHHRCCHPAGTGISVATGMHGTGHPAQHPGLCASPTCPSTILLLPCHYSSLVQCCL